MSCKSQWWYPRDGIPVRIIDMEDDHLENAIKSMNHKIEWAADRLAVLENEQYRRMKRLPVGTCCPACDCCRKEYS